jgi:hypothetical protein
MLPVSSFHFYGSIDLTSKQIIFSSTYKLDVVIVERSSYDPFEEVGGEPAADGLPGHSSARRRQQQQQQQEDSPYRLVWSVLRSILEILIEAVL